MKPSQFVDVEPLSLRASVGSINEAARTADVIFTTGAAVDRVDFRTGQRYREVLSTNPAHVRTDRLNSGAPLLNAHNAYSSSDVLGIVEPGSARLQNGKGVATVRFSKRDDVEPIFQDVVDGIIRSVSVGYRVHKLEENTPKAGEPLIRTAIDWEPFELSMVPMPADPGARVRAGSEANVCEIIERSVEDDEEPVDDDEESFDDVPDFHSERACEVRRIHARHVHAGTPCPEDVLDELVRIIWVHQQRRSR